MKITNITALTVLVVSAYGCSGNVTQGKRPYSAEQDISLTRPGSSFPVRPQAGSLYFLNSSLGWATCGTDLLCGTHDGGKTWQVLNRGALEYCQELSFANERVGWALVDEWSTGDAKGRKANFILRTEDGGRTWSEVLRSNSPIYGIDAINESTAYVRPRWLNISLTIDGGHTWSEVRVDKSLGLFEGLRKVFFVNDKDGWGYGGAIWRTHDGGKTWSQVVDEESINGTLFDGCFIDEKTGWLVGSDCQIWRTTDGKTWQRMGLAKAIDTRDLGKARSEDDLYSVTFANSSVGWIVGLNNSLLQSVDGGQTWTVLATFPNGLRAIRFTTLTEGWAIDDRGRLLRTVDGGKSFKAYPVI